MNSNMSVQNQNEHDEHEQFFYDFIKIMNQLRREIIFEKKLSDLMNEFSPKLIDIREKLANDSK